MKLSWIITLGLLTSAGMVEAQTVKVATEVEKSTAKKVLKEPRKVAPNEIAVRKVSYTGVLPQLGKTTNPVELIDPRAPAEAGKAEDNTVVDPISKKPRGIIFLRLSW